MLLHFVMPGALVLGTLPILALPALAATQTAVSLTFDNGSISQYTLGYQQALQPHGAKATFFVNSGTVVSTSSANFMSWAQIGTLAGDGNDIGGKSVNATNLTTDPSPTTQVCNDRAALIAHGLSPVAFAYPGGATNTAVQTVVKNCGYGNARTAGGLSATGATYAETLPPANWLATRAYAPVRGDPGKYAVAGQRSRLAQRRVEPDRDRQGLLAGPGPGQLQHLQLVQRPHRARRSEHVPGLDGQCGAGRRSPGRGHPGHRELGGEGS